MSAIGYNPIFARTRTVKIKPTMMSLLPRKKSPAYLVIGAVLLFMGIINFSGDKGTVTPQAIMFNTLYLVVIAGNEARVAQWGLMRKIKSM